MTYTESSDSRILKRVFWV